MSDAFLLANTEYYRKVLNCNVLSGKGVIYARYEDCRHEIQNSYRTRKI